MIGNERRTDFESISVKQAKVRDSVSISNDRLFSSRPCREVAAHGPFKQMKDWSTASFGPCCLEVYPRLRLHRQQTAIKLRT